MQPSADQSYDRPSSVKVDEEHHQIIIQGERHGHGTDESIRQALDQKHNCKWIQRGNYLICTEGGYEHGSAIHPNDRFQGVDKNGIPILKRLDVDNL